MVVDGMRVIVNDVQTNEGSSSGLFPYNGFCTYFTKVPIPFTFMIFEDVIPKILLFILCGFY